MSINVVDGKGVDNQPAMAREDCRQIVYIGIFIDGILSQHSLSNALSSVYRPTLGSECDRRYVVCSTIGRSRLNSLSQFDDDVYSDLLTDQVVELFAELGVLLGASYKYAVSLKIILDFYAIDDGSFAAAIVCDAIEPGKIKGSEEFCEKARGAVNGGGIFEDLRNKGCEMILNSYTHFDTSTISGNDPQSDNDKSLSETPDNSSLFLADSTERDNGSSQYLLRGYVSKSEEIESNPDGYYIADRRNWLQKAYGRVFTWRYTANRAVREKIDDWERTLTILSIANLSNGIGELLEGVCIILNGASTLISLDMACMTIRNDKDRNDNFARARNSAIGLIPWGKIVGKSVSAGFDFILKKTSKRPNLKVIQGGNNHPPTPPSHSETRKNNIVKFPQNNSETNVVPIRKSATEIVVQEANGGFITIGETPTPNLTIYSYDGKLSGINNLGAYLRGSSQNIYSAGQRVEPVDSSGSLFNSNSEAADPTRLLDIKDKRVLDELFLLEKKIRNNNATLLEIKRFKQLMNDSTVRELLKLMQE